MAKLDILSIGSISIDYIESETFFGGTAANVAVNGGRLGLATGVYSAASSSDWGRRYIDFLAAEDVAYMHLPHHLEKLPEYHASLNSDGTLKNVEWHDNGIARAFKLTRRGAGALREAPLPPAKIIHFGACEPSYINKVIKEAPDDQIFSYNPGGWLTYEVDYFSTAYPQTHFLFLNEYEYQCLVSAGLAQNPLDLLVNDSQVIVITRGSKPIWLAHNAALLSKATLAEIPVNRVAAVDETGAGDAFISAFLFGWVKERPLETCVRMGIEFGGLVAQQLGAQAKSETVHRFIGLAAGL